MQTKENGKLTTKCGKTKQPFEWVVIMTYSIIPLNADFVERRRVRTKKDLIEGENPVNVLAGDALRHGHFSIVFIASHDLWHVAS